MATFFRMSCVIRKASILLLVCASCIWSFKVTFERAYITYANPKYLEYAFVNVTRYVRKSGYYANIEFDHKYETNNNVTIHIYLCEFLRNQYKRSFIEFHHKLCDFLTKDPYIGKVAALAGLHCPVKAGKYTLMNLTAHYEHIRNVFPFEKGRIDFFFNATSTGEPIAAASGYLSFKNELKGRRKG